MRSVPQGHPCEEIAAILVEIAETPFLLLRLYEQSLLGHFGPLITFTNMGSDVKPFQVIGTQGII